MVSISLPLSGFQYCTPPRNGFLMWYPLTLLTIMGFGIYLWFAWLPGLAQ